MKKQESTPLNEGDRKLIESLGKKYEEAMNKNDAAAVAALFAEDAVQVAPEGLFFGRQAIEKRYADGFESGIFSDNIRKSNELNGIGDVAWSVGEWSCTVETEDGPVHLKGYRSSMYVRDGDDWKIRVSTFNIPPPPDKPEPK
jgi:uncharacterized protein (TIGR02246 family)